MNTYADYVQVFSAGLDHVWVLVEEQSTPNPDASPTHMKRPVVKWTGATAFGG